MTTVTGLTAARMAEIEAAAIVDAEVVGDDLILTKHDSTTLNAGNVRGPQGLDGDPGADGIGLPAGGTTGQVLAKVDGTDYNVLWSTLLRYATLNIQTDSYNLQLSDGEGLVEIYSASAKTVTILADTYVDFPIGTRIGIIQAGPGDVHVAAGVGVTLGWPEPYVATLLGVGAKVDIIKLYDNAWILVGNGNLETTEAGWQTFTPTITAFPSGPPNLGTTPVREGYYMIDSKGRVTGGATIRWDTAGSPSQGTASVYKLLLPVDGVNYDDNGYTPIGNVSVGMSDLRHNAGCLHFCGNLSNDPLNADVGKAIGAMEGGLFLSATVPSRTSPTTRTVGNVHYAFHYQADPSEY